jgi:hypothetical protein
MPQAVETEQGQAQEKNPEQNETPMTAPVETMHAPPTAPRTHPTHAPDVYPHVFFASLHPQAFFGHDLCPFTFIEFHCSPLIHSGPRQTVFDPLKQRIGTCAIPCFSATYRFVTVCNSAWPP